MISPDIATAIARLERDGLVSSPRATLLGRAARGELVSADLLLHALLYGGVLAVTGGVGLLVKDRIADLGPLAIAALIGAAALGCLAWCARVARPFSTGAAPSPHVAFDYILTLGALLLAADLAWIEWRFTPLGANWAWHLLLVSATYAILALRFDSRVVFVLALTSFAAWRGVAAISVEQVFFGWAGGALAVRLNGIACGLLFIAAGQLLRHFDFKAHFEPAATLLGWALLLMALGNGMASDDGSGWLHRFALLAVGVFLAVCFRHSDRFALFVMGVLAAYLALLELTLPGIDHGPTAALYVAMSAIALLVGLLRVRSRRPGRDP